MKPPKTKNDHSLRRQLMQWLLIPWCALWILNSLISYPLATQLANDAYDRDLLNSADSVAARVQIRNKNVSVDLPPAAQAILRYNNKDRFFYQVATEDGKNISGDDIPLPARFPELGHPRFSNAKVGDQDVRVASIVVVVPSQSADPILIQTAETLSSRRQLIEQILITIILPQLALIIIGALAISFGVARGLRPLAVVREAISARTQHDLRPVDHHMAPVEVRPLVVALNELLAQLREDLESQSRFVANATHQLRTPLAGLKTYLGLARRINKEPKVAELLEQIDSGTDRMTRLVNRLLALAKAEPQNQRRVNFDRVDLNDIASESSAQLVTEALNKDIELSFEASSSAAQVYGDRGALLEMASNLIENAVRYTQNGGIVTVSVKSEPICQLIVTDNGPGIPEAERELVFERFYRVLDHNVSGSGLGLSIVDEIARAHHADIQLTESGHGSGSRFIVSFPRSNEGQSELQPSGDDTSVSHNSH